MEDEVKHYVVYHNTEVMGYRPRDFDDLDEGTSFSIATNKSVTNLPGNIIWLISGEERPRKYYLCSVFVVDEVGSLEADDFKNYAAGQQGISFHIQPRQNLSVLVIFEKPENEWHWIMRPQLVNSIRDLGWFSDSSTPNILGDLEQQRQTYETVDQTTRQAIVQSRIGQGQFRIALIDYWAGCAVTGCQVVDLLVASHIKPWRDANNVERLDRFNGLLLQPNLDAAFDKGYISFDDSGRILISRSLSSEALLQLGINFSMKLRWVEEGHRQYLEYHRRVNGF